MCQSGLDVDAAKLLNRLKMWPMVTIGAKLDENSKTFARKLMGVRSPLPAPFQIRYLFSRLSVLRGVSRLKLCQKCASAIPERDD
jgi:hypothetical protein